LGTVVDALEKNEILTRLAEAVISIDGDAVKEAARNGFSSEMLIFKFTLTIPRKIVLP